MIIDTNVLIYDTFKDLEKHGEARNILNSLHEWFIPSVVLIEFIAFLNKVGLRDEEILDKLEELMRNPKFILIGFERGDVLKSLENVRREKISPLHINDKIILNVAQRLRKKLITFDKRLLSQLGEKEKFRSK